MESKSAPAKREVGGGYSRAVRPFIFLAFLGLLSCMASTPPAKASKGIINPSRDTSSAAQASAEDLGHATGGRLDPAHIQRVVHARFSQIHGCYERILLQMPNAFGVVSVHLVIDQNGYVSDARPSLSGNLPVEMNACVEQVFRSLKFDAPVGGVVTLDYPVVFVPSAEPPLEGE